MNIQDSGVVGGFSTSIKADIGSFSGLSFGGYEYGGDRYRAPAGNPQNYYGTAGNVSDFDAYCHYLEGYTIEGLLNVTSFVEAHKNVTNDLLCGFQFGGGDTYPKTYIGIKVRNWQYEDRGNYKWVNPEWAVVKRVYQDYTTFSETDISQALGFTSRARIYIASPQSEEISWKLIFTFKEYTSGGVPYLLFGITYVRDDGSCNLTDNMLVSIKKDYLKNTQSIDVDQQPHSLETKSSSFGDPAWPAGYGVKDADGNIITGSFDDSSDTIAIDNKPSLNPFGLGFINAYEMSSSTWDLLAEALFPDLDFSSATDLIGWLSKLVEVTFTKNRVDCILGAIAIPCQVAKSASPANVHAGGTILKYTDQGGVTHNLTAYEVTEPFVDVDCGTLHVPEYYANFLDFAGTEAKLFLPGCGFINLKAEYFNGGTLGVKYRINVIDGSFMCYVTSTSSKSKLTSSLIGQYSGSMCVRLPISGNDYSQLASGLISSIGGGALAAATGGATAALSAAGVANLTNTMLAKPQMQNSNGYNASSAYMSNKKPFLIIERKAPQFSEAYNKEMGLPLNVFTKIGYCSGFTQAQNPILDGIPCTDAERERIRAALQNGIIIR